MVTMLLVVMVTFCIVLLDIM